MNTGSYVFAQMVKFLDEFVFLRIVKKYDGDKYVKLFSCWNQLLTLMFGQLTGKPSLRRFIIASAPHTQTNAYLNGCMECQPQVHL